MGKEQERFQQEQKEATRVQEDLLQEIHQEEIKQKKLEKIEKELQGRIREGEELEKYIQQALDQELARNIEADKKTCGLFLENNSLKFHLSSELDREKLVLPIKFNNSYVEDLKSHWDFKRKNKGDIDLKRLGQIPELGATIIQYFGEDWDAELGDYKNRI